MAPSKSYTLTKIPFFTTISSGPIRHSNTEDIEYIMTLTLTFYTICDILYEFHNKIDKSGLIDIYRHKDSAHDL